MGKGTNIHLQVRADHFALSEQREHPLYVCELHDSQLLIRDAVLRLVRGEE